MFDGRNFITQSQGRALKVQAYCCEDIRPLKLLNPERNRICRWLFVRVPAVQSAAHCCPTFWQPRNCDVQAKAAQQPQGRPDFSIETRKGQGKQGQEGLIAYRSEIRAAVGSQSAVEQRAFAWQGLVWG